MPGGDEPFIVDVGCGDNKWDGAFGVDFRELPGVDLVADVSKLTPDQLPRPADALIARHVLEHFPVRETQDILINWVECLAPGGVIRIEVPRMDFIARHWNDRPGDIEHQRWLLDMAYGGQDYPGNFHMTLYSPELLRHEMRQAGLINVTIHDAIQVAVGFGEKPDGWTRPNVGPTIVKHFPVRHA